MRVIKHIALVFALFVVLGTVASAKVSSCLVTFGQDFIVSGTTVKAGTYKLTFDDKTHELTIADKKTKAVIARTTGRSEKRKTATVGMDVKMVDEGSNHVLTSVAFPGDSNSIQLDTVSASVTSNK
jgi:hypothetical protein